MSSNPAIAASRSASTIDRRRCLPVSSCEIAGRCERRERNCEVVVLRSGPVGEVETGRRDQLFDEAPLFSDQFREFLRSGSAGIVGVEAHDNLFDPARSGPLADRRGCDALRLAGLSYLHRPSGGSMRRAWK